MSVETSAEGGAPQGEPREAEVGDAARPQRLARRLWASPLLRKNLGAAGGLTAVFILFSVLLAATRGLSFADPANLETIFRQTTIVAMAALGATIVIVSGGIDLSVGAIIALATVVIAAFLRAGAPPLAAALVGIVAGAGCGALNGLLVTRLKVVPFIVTLGTMLVVRGVAKGLAHDQKIDAPKSWLNELLARLPADGTWRSWLVVPPGVWMLLVLAVAVGALLLYTRLGRHIFAVGSNEQAARLCGISVGRAKLVVYVLGGFFAGIAGLMQFSRLTVGDPTGASGLELNVIAAVVIGGGSLSGGEGSVLGCLIGALIMQVLQSGCSQMGWPNWVQEIVTGAIIVAAVALDRFRHRRSA
jgi:ribose/xylose/arabinose/galactoside ABC-type transport system permease subunit